MTPTSKARLAIVVSHPIQYQAPLFRRLAASGVVEPEVLFLSDHGVRPSLDPGFGMEIAYDVPLLDGYRHRFLPNRSPSPSVDRALGLFNPSVVRAVARSRCDALLVHGWAHLSDWLALGSAWTRRIPYLVRGEARSDTDVALRAGRRRAKRALIGPLTRHAAGCLAIGSLNRRFYLDYGVPPERIYTVPYAVDNERFERDGAAGRARRPELLASFGLDPGLPTVLFAAKLQAWKRPADLVEAAGHLRHAVNIVIIGDGPHRSELESRSEHAVNVRLLGFVNQSEIAQWYGAADVFVLPSSREPWGLAVNEAMAAGAIPVVSDAVGCAPDLVGPDAGRVFRCGDPVDLARRIDEVLDLDLDALRAAGRRRVDAHSIDIAAQGIEAAVLAAVARR